MTTMTATTTSPLAATLPQTADYVLIGGGLQNGLLALALRHHQPKASVVLIERESRLGGEHTWSFHAFDADFAVHPWAKAFVEYEWPCHEVAFPRYRRLLLQPYRSCTSNHFDRVLRQAAANDEKFTIVTGAEALPHANGSTIIGGRFTLSGTLTIDARGPSLFPAQRAIGYQKFLGLELKLGRPCPSSVPMLMDATVTQRDGFRFFYVLPFAPDRVLIEETFYSDTPEIDEQKLTASVLTYAGLKGYDVREIVRTETGSLPLPGALAEAPAFNATLTGGYAGGWFHPTTGYSFPAAVRVAETIAVHTKQDDLKSSWQRLAAKHRRQSRYCIWLNRFLFGAFAPHHRRNVLERFYRLPEPAVNRFYAMQMTKADCFRIIWGLPPEGMSLRMTRQKGSPL